MPGVIIHGTYQFRPRRVAFRNDFCIQCNTPRTAICVRTLDVIHVYWIPVLPLGFFRRWYCATCGARPNEARTARRSIKVLAMLTAAIMAALLWMAPFDGREPPADLVALWAFRIGFTVAVIGTIYWIAVGSDDVVRRRRVAGLPPNDALDCPICAVRLVPGDVWRCPLCGIVRR
jgi:hypothetical protein